MKKLILHPATRQQLDAFIKTPSQVVLVSGPAGIGKLTIAKRLAESILELSEDSFDSYGYGLTISSEAGKAIGIDSARQLERFMRLKVPSGKAYNRVAIIEDSHLMTVEAQNALLKTLEEPPAGTLIIMTVSYEPTLLPTVRSRAQVLAVQNPERQALHNFFVDRGFGVDEVAKVRALSGGSPGLMSTLLENDEHPLRLATEQARELLSQPLYERLITVETLAKDRALAIDTVNILQRMARISLENASDGAVRRWQAVLKASYQTAEALNANAQPKLALTYLALRF